MIKQTKYDIKYNKITSREHGLDINVIIIYFVFISLFAYRGHLVKVTDKFLDMDHTIFF